MLKLMNFLKISWVQITPQLRACFVTSMKPVVRYKEAKYNNKVQTLRKRTVVNFRDVSSFYRCRRN